MVTENLDELEKLETRKAYLEEWLFRFRKAQAVVSIVQMNLDQTNWEIDAWRNRPAEAGEILTPYLSQKFDRENQFLQKAFHPMPNYEMTDINRGTAVMISGSSILYEYVAKVGDLGTKNAIAYSSHYTAQYRELQEAQQRPAHVRSMIEAIGSRNTLERFDRAYLAFIAYRSSAGSKPAAGMEIRTLMDGIQGDLFALARKWPKENMIWETMVDRLAIGEPNGIAHKELLDQERVRSTLISRLSQIGKDREGESITNLDSIWTEILDHLFTVLGLIDFERQIEKRDQDLDEV